MNYSVKWQDFDGEIIETKTFTIYEAKAIVKHVLSNNCSNATIEPLNEKAKFEKEEYEMLENLLDNILAKFKK